MENCPKQKFVTRVYMHVSIDRYSPCKHILYVELEQTNTENKKFVREEASEKKNCCMRGRWAILTRIRRSTRLRLQSLRLLFIFWLACWQKFACLYISLPSTMVVTWFSLKFELQCSFFIYFIYGKIFWITKNILLWMFHWNFKHFSDNI